MKIFIPCAGIGSRLEYLTKNLNKSLITIGNKPAISHIIEKFSNQYIFVIALGYRGDLLKQYLKLAHPEYNFEFVNIQNYDGKDSGLGLTIYSCIDKLQEPFIFIPTDSIFEESEDYLLNNPDTIFFSDIFDEEYQYRKLKITQGYLDKILDKNVKGLSYTGICHIKSYKNFWKNACLTNEFISEGESYLINLMKDDVKINCKKLSWHDIGNLKSLEKVRKIHPSSYNILEKENEAIWFLKDRVIKYHDDVNFIRNRVNRFNLLKGFVPNLIDHSENMYCYEYMKGKTLSEDFDLKVMKDLLFYLGQFWVTKNINNYDDFKERCLSFYKDKTIKRIKLYQDISQNDCEVINGINVGKINDLLNRIDWNGLSKGIPSTFHGDLHFENILKCNDGKFCLLDWRQDFEGNLEIGDVYYDFAKLLHGMIIAHDFIKQNYFTIKYLDSNSVYFDFHVKQLNIVAQEMFLKYLKDRSYSIFKVKLLTALIFLNIAPLHHEPYNHMLYYLGKLNLHLVLENL